MGGSRMRAQGRPRAAVHDTVAVALGGALGGTARFGVDTLLTTSSLHPAWATAGVNVLGAFALGVVTSVVPLSRGAERLRLFLAVGVLGSFTTFSTWMLQELDLLAGGQAGAAAVFLLGTLGLGLLAASAGLSIGTRLRRQQRGGRA